MKREFSNIITDFQTHKHVSHHYYFLSFETDVRTGIIKNPIVKYWNLLTAYLGIIPYIWVYIPGSIPKDSKPKICKFRWMEKIALWLEPILELVMRLLRVLHRGIAFPFCDEWFILSFVYFGSFSIRVVLTRALCNLIPSGATVYMVCRSKERGEEALAKLQSTTSNPNIHLEVCSSRYFNFLVLRYFYVVSSVFK